MSSAAVPRTPREIADKVERQIQTKQVFGYPKRQEE